MMHRPRYRTWQIILAPLSVSILTNLKISWDQFTIDRKHKPLITIAPLSEALQ